MLSDRSVSEILSCRTSPLLCRCPQLLTDNIAFPHTSVVTAITAHGGHGDSRQAHSGARLTCTVGQGGPPDRGAQAMTPPIHGILRYTSKTRLMCRPQHSAVSQPAQRVRTIHV